MGLSNLGKILKFEVSHGQNHNKKGKVSIQTNLERNPFNSSYIFLLDVNYKNLTVGLHVFIIYSMLAKLQEYQ